MVKRFQGLHGACTVFQRYFSGVKKTCFNTVFLLCVFLLCVPFRCISSLLLLVVFCYILIGIVKSGNL